MAIRLQNSKNSQLKISDARFEHLIGYSGNAAQPNQLSGVGIILENSELYSLLFENSATV